MAASSMPSTLPEVLFDGWRLRKHDISEAQKHGGLKEWTVSSLCSEYLQYQLQRHEREVAAKAQACPSLALLSIGRIVETLRSSTSLPADSKAVAEDLPSTTLHRIIQDPRTPYIVLRAFDSLTSTTIRGSNGDRKIVDIDEAVLAAERYVRSSQIKPSDGYLVTLGDLSRMFGPADAAGLITLKRKSPPKGGFEFLHQKRKKTVLIQGTDACFVKTFDRVTQDALKGLDWSHVFVAGGMVLNTLLHIDDLSKDIHGDIKDCDIDLYLYDLNPEEATRKVEEIYKVWSTNVLDHDSSSNIPPARHMVVKNAKTINFIPEYPGRRVQIILKLLPSPLDVLLNFDLDVCALGFDGSRVLMLPRCARAIETGYSTFTMDLIWGHHLGNRRETQEIRVFKYADRGFGLRILPSYVRSLGEDKFGDTASLQQAHPLVGTRDDEVERDRNGPTRVFEGETGLKSLRRISYLARKFVHRCYFGPFKVLDHTERARQHRLTYEDGWNDDMSDEDFDEDVSDEDEDEDVSEEDETDDEMLSEEASDGEEGEENVSPEEQAAEQAIGKTGFLGPWDHQSEDQPCTDPCSNADENPVDGLESCPIIRLCAMDGFSTHEGLPDGPRSLAVFEVLMRHCEAWRLDAVGLARLDRASYAEIAYDTPTSYHGLPKYDWGPDCTTSMDDFETKVNDYNDRLFRTLRTVVGRRLNINPFQGSYMGYLTRRIRHIIVGRDLEAVQSKQLTTPLLIPMALENYIMNDLSSQYDGIPGEALPKLLLPAHDPLKYDPANTPVPSLPDTVEEKGNLRYWLVTNKSMWAGQHRVVDEVSELLVALSEYFAKDILLPDDLDTGASECIRHLLAAFRRRLVLPEMSDTTERGQILPPREARLFRAWALTRPPAVERSFEGDDGIMQQFEDDLAQDEDVSDNLFWQDGDEGSWDEEGVPVWQALND